MPTLLKYFPDLERSVLSNPSSDTAETVNHVPPPSDRNIHYMISAAIPKVFGTRTADTT